MWVAQAFPEGKRPDEALAELLRGPWGPVVRAAAVLVVLALLALVAVRGIRRRSGRASKVESDYGIAADILPDWGPPEVGPRLLYRNTPVRLAAVVLAPSGRARELPPINRLGEVFDALVPGLADVIRAHRPVYRRWPAQVSTRGFVHRFFAEAQVLAPPGTSSAWCLAGGTFVFRDEPLLVGLVMRAALPTSLARAIVEEPAEWLRLLSVEQAASDAGASRPRPV